MSSPATGEAKYNVTLATTEILRFDGMSGALIDAFVTGGPLYADGLVFGPDGDLFVTVNIGGVVLIKLVKQIRVPKAYFPGISVDTVGQKKH